MRRSLYSYTLEELRDYISSLGLARFSADTIFNWVYKKHNFNIGEWESVSKRIRAKMVDDIEFSLPKIKKISCSTDGTKKFLFELSDGEVVESVAIPAKGRLTICLSSQVGCAIGCKFCFTATMGFTRSLEVHEVVGQLLGIVSSGELQETRISNLVYMGQGEPLNNFENMKKATEIFMENKGLGIGQRKITLSTSGLAHQIRRLVDFPPVNLALSLHSPFDEVREKLIPINKKWNIAAVMEAIRSLPIKTHRAITYEYLLIAGLTDRIEDVIELSKILDVKTSKINLIPFNEYPGSEFKRPTDEQIAWFKDELLKRDFMTTTRISKGDDILAACGQLKGSLPMLPSILIK